MTKQDGIKSKLQTAVEGCKGELVSISLAIHDNPELGFEEYKACDMLCGFLTKNGFEVERDFCGLKTAFKASYGSGKPHIALLAEYDALPGIGHACGHNLICTASAGAAVSLKKAVDKYGGTISVIGTPAEEGAGGKLLMAAKGAFDGLDAAIITHPGTQYCATIKALAAVSLDVEFFGREAHASSHNDEGINALDALICAFNSINALRQHIRDGSRIHGIITDGGKAPNIVPGYSAGTFLLRAAEEPYLETLKGKVIDCLLGAAQATGARLEYKWGERAYAPMYNNLKLAKLFVENMKLLGHDMLLEDKTLRFGSTDMGNVSKLVPSIHPIFAIAEKNIIGHTKAFAEAAASERGLSSMVDSAKAIAMTCADLLSSHSLLTEIKEEFSK